VNNWKTELRDLPEYLWGHFLLSAVALSFSIVIGITLGVFCQRHRRFRYVVIFLTQIIQTIPGLALLAMMVPVFSYLNIYSEFWLHLHIAAIGFYPAVIALVLYSLLPIFRNTLLGLESIHAHIREAAESVGMTLYQQLWMVELPLALPFIVGGIRTASVWVIGMAVLSTPIGAPSLGNFIFSGLQTRNHFLVLMGCLFSASMALILDALWWWIEKLLRFKKINFIGLMIAFLTLWAISISYYFYSLSGNKNVFTIGAKPITEQYILANILESYIHKQINIPTRIMPSLGSAVVFDSLRHGEIDAYVEYTGYLTQVVYSDKFKTVDYKNEKEMLKKCLKEQNILLIADLGFNNSYVIAWLDQQQAWSKNLTQLADLKNWSHQLRIGSDYEFFKRKDWVRLQSLYGLHFLSHQPMDSAFLYKALKEGEVDLITAYYTDGRIDTDGLNLLSDPQHALADYQAVLLLSDRHQYNLKVLSALKHLEHFFSVETMRKLNAEVDGKHKNPKQVADDFMKSYESIFY
jgi:osmoprotectant transport system permease protein